MNSQKTVENVSFKVYLKNSNNGTDDEVKRFVVESDAAISITQLKVKNAITTIMNFSWTYAFYPSTGEADFHLPRDPPEGKFRPQLDGRG